jgi:hypothetical protein
MKLETKANWAIGLSVVALIFVAIMFILWCCNVGGFSAVNLDTFVGVIVALLAIIVTIAIGWQIWAAMDLRANIAILDKRIKDAEELKLQFGKQQNAIEQLSLKNKHVTGFTWGKSAIKDQNWCSAFRYLTISLSASLQLDSPINVESILAFMSEISKKLQPHTKYAKEYYQEIVEADGKIRLSHNFSLIKERYKELYDDILSKIEIDDSQK